MATYVSLIRIAQQAGSDPKEGPQRIKELRQGLRALGVELRHFYMLMGQYDALAILEARDDEAAMRAAFALFGSGGLRTETLRAFTENEFRELVGLDL
jgi:uncharacterized protein with GYD domain